MSEPIPPIHEVVRFWRRSESATLARCVGFRNTSPPYWSLSWLRQAAPVIMTRQITQAALRRAVREKVAPDAQSSVLKAVELFCAFAERHKWTGREVRPRAYKLPSGVEINVSPIGRYFSQVTNSEWLVALQPRQENFPNDEQFAMWRSVLFYSFCNGNDDAMIVDLSKSSVSQKRQISEVTARKYPLVDLYELNLRLEQTAACYKRAVDIVPERPRRKIKKKDDEPSFEF